MAEYEREEATERLRNHGPGPGHGPIWAVFCPDEPNAPLIAVSPFKDEADRAAEEHNAEFTPPHNAEAEKYDPVDD
jgi:hypothetical protein